MAASFSTLTTRAVAASLDKMPSDQIAALPASVRQKIITEARPPQALTDDASGTLAVATRSSAFAARA